MPTFQTFFFILVGLLILYIGYLIGTVITALRWKTQLPKHREAAVKKSRSVLTGQFSEQLAPYLPDFPYDPTEVRFLGTPVDLVVFEGISKNNPTQITFVEVKTGDAKLSTNQRKLRDIVKKKKVAWREYKK